MMSAARARCIFWLAALSTVATLPTLAAERAPLLTPVAAIEIPHSSGSFDFLRVDPKRDRLLGAHEKGGSADYFDLRANKLLTRLRVGAAVDTAVDSDAGFYYVSVQEAGRVAVVDAARLQEVGSIKTNGPTDAIIYEPKTRLVYVTHDDGTEVWIIDPAARKVIGTVAIPGEPEFMIYDASSDRIYLNIKSKDSVAVIDPSTNKVVGQWPTAPASRPHGMALDGVHHHIFSAGANGKLVEMDSQSGSIISSVDIAPKVDQIAFDVDSGIIYCAGAGQLSVVRVSGDSLTLLGNQPTAATARNVAVDPKTHLVWTTFTDGKSSFAKSWRLAGH